MSIKIIANLQNDLITLATRYSFSPIFEHAMDCILPSVDEIGLDIRDFYDTDALVSEAAKKKYKIPKPTASGDKLHPEPRPGFLLRRNYDYGEGWPRIVDDYVKKQKKKLKQKALAARASFPHADWDRLLGEIDLIGVR